MVDNKSEIGITRPVMPRGCEDSTSKVDILDILYVVSPE